MEKEAGYWINVNHAYVRGIADPTGKIPPGHVYVTGIKNQDTRDLIEKNQIFMTRIPSMKCSQATMMRVIIKKPKGMTDSEFEWLEELPFGAIIFGFPSEGKLPIPEVIGGDLDGDRYFCKCTAMITFSKLNYTPSLASLTLSYVFLFQ